MMTAVRNNIPNIGILAHHLHPYIMQRKMLCKMAIFQEENSRIWLISDKPLKQVPSLPDQRESLGLHKIFCNFRTKDPNYTEQKYCVRLRYRSYHIFVDSNQAFMLVSQKQNRKSCCVFSDTRCIYWNRLMEK